MLTFKGLVIGFEARFAMRTQPARLHCIDMVLAIALAANIHGTHDAVRQTAGRLRDRVPLENRPQMARLMRHENALGVAGDILKNTVNGMGW